MAILTTIEWKRTYPQDGRFSELQADVALSDDITLSLCAVPVAYNEARGYHAAITADDDGAVIIDETADERLESALSLVFGEPEDREPVEITVDDITERYYIVAVSL